MLHPHSNCFIRLKEMPKNVQMYQEIPLVPKLNVYFITKGKKKPEYVKSNLLLCQGCSHVLQKLVTIKKLTNIYSFFRFLLENVNHS